ncbi:hypothetical protein ZIOFF_001876 [Zingiber officinale]|uniref:Uncharacterized protein n=2 Tax=Zingiber officinale TaxID=94328 RepID=A0A8J5M924_ZINOF|nr:hypothetical protein ZIOFF_001876 [Zingiber officinale]
MKQRCLSLLQSCSSMAQLRQIHARLLSSGLASDRFLASELLRFCALSPLGDLLYARSLLLSLPDPSSSSWNHLIRAFTDRNLPYESILHFLLMRRGGGGGGATPNELTFPFVLKSCTRLAALRLGIQTHADAAKRGVDAVVYVQNALVSLYSSCSRIDEARQLFEEMSLWTVVSWNTILTAHAENSMAEECAGIFDRMRRCGFDADQTTYVILLSASAELGSLSYGRWLHGRIAGSGLATNVQLGTAIVNMYAKCGALKCAGQVFDRMPLRNVWTWSAMILGLAQHGLARNAIELFDEMKHAFVEPNYVTFLGVISACSHAGLVDVGLRLFHEMIEQHGIKPRMSHCSAMVDLLGRNGHLQEAYDFVQRMPIEPDAVVWRTLLSTCQLHPEKDETGIGQEAKRRLLELEPRRVGNYIMAANMYSDQGSWDEAAKVRRRMREEGLRKAPGESCIEVGGGMHRFISGDNYCSNGYKSILIILNALKLNMKERYEISMDST